jgi:hypothetical protein
MRFLCTFCRLLKRALYLYLTQISAFYISYSILNYQNHCSQYSHAYAFLATSGCVFSSDLLCKLVGAVKALLISSLIGLQHETDSAYIGFIMIARHHTAVDFQKSAKKNV